MPKIKLLSEDLICKIAAGEVIERPASVVKELIENSLDAKATKIVAEIKDSGKESIKVTDNGEGMDELDARNSVLRHTTSKIQDENDLYSLHSLGFRGEALASIAAVSQISLTTKQKGRLEGFNLVLESGTVISSGAIGAEEGTCLDVRNLFFNTPARKKFLKTDAVELRHIIDLITVYALSYPQVTFKLFHDGHELLNSPSVGDQRSNIASIYGLKLARELMEVNQDTDAVKIKGYLAPPSSARNDKNQQVIFINGRWVKNEDIVKTVYDAYHSLLFVGKHPVMVLSLEIDPEKIDVNVHPAKTLVKMEQKDAVCNAVFTAVKETLQRNNLIPTLDLEFERQTSLKYSAPVPARREAVYSAAESTPVYSFEPSAQTILKVEESGEPFMVSEQQLVKEMEPTAAFPAMKVLGQIHKTFFVAETQGGVFFIDQHAAHERVLYETFMEQFLSRKVSLQTLLQGDLIELSPSEKLAWMEHKDEMENFGFRMEPFGANTYLIKTIPEIFGKVQPKELVYELLSSLQQKSNSLQQKKEEIITMMACRSAVMAGEVLAISEMERILKELSTKKHPYTCPHGRPTVFKITAEELEIKFKRRG